MISIKPEFIKETKFSFLTNFFISIFRIARNYQKKKMLRLIASTLIYFKKFYTKFDCGMAKSNVSGIN